MIIKSITEYQYNLEFKIKNKIVGKLRSTTTYKNLKEFGISPNDELKIICILDTVEVDLKFRGQGIFHKLMIEFINYCKIKFKDSYIVINACPYSISPVDPKIPLEKLCLLYESFGFKVVDDQVNNKILTLRMTTNQ